jgi:hypothetical protein
MMLAVDCKAKKATGRACTGGLVEKGIKGKGELSMVPPLTLRQCKLARTIKAKKEAGLKGKEGEKR